MSTYLCIIVKMTRQRLLIPSHSFYFFQENAQNLKGRQSEMGAFSAFLEGTCDHMTTFWLIRCKQMSYSSFQKQPSRMLMLPTVPSCPSNESGWRPQHGRKLQGLESSRKPPGRESSHHSWVFIADI